MSCRVRVADAATARLVMAQPLPWQTWLMDSGTSLADSHPARPCYRRAVLIAQFTRKLHKHSPVGALHRYALYVTLVLCLCLCPIATSDRVTESSMAVVTRPSPL